MPNIFKASSYIILILLNINSIFAQDRRDILKTPSTIPVNKPFDFGLLSAPDQIGFGRLSIDTVKYNTSEKMILNSPGSYRSVRLSMLLNEKEFSKWELETFNTARLSLTILSGKILRTSSLSLFGVPVSISYMAPGKAATKLSTDGLPPIYPIQARQRIEIRKHIERIEHEMQEKRKNAPFDGVDDMFDVVFCFTQAIKKVNFRQFKT
ncbi:MAG: hypothetical protein LBL90_10130 [Prevotellaceae bacterium]|nr:hypothetical protein [Prevotellaceae bacterium]